MTCNQPKPSLKKFIILSMMALLSAGMGCQKPTATTTNPTTPYEPQVQNRNWSQQVVYYQPVALEHKALYLAGPFEQSGGDGIFDKTTNEDLLATFACPAMFLGNVVAMPAAMILTSPFQNQQSRSIFPIEAAAYEPLALQSNP